jgi:histidinol-phosphate aminotransferase
MTRRAVRPARAWVRDAVRRAPTYASGGGQAPIRLDRNESPEELAPDLREDVLRRLASQPWSRYADPWADELRERLAARENLSPGAVLVGNGSNALILSLFVALAAPDRRIALLPPTFGLYEPWIRATGMEPVLFPLDEDSLGPATDRIVAAAEADRELAVLICSPNNPTGTLFPRPGLEAILATGALVVMDEAYVEFSKSSARDLLATNPNLILLRTFSKAAALAGARVGYVIADPEFVAELVKVVPPFAVNLFGRAAALSLLSDEARLSARIAGIISERARLLGELARVAGARCSDSRANFVYLRPERAPVGLHEELRRRGVLVRRVAGTMGADALRVTIGRPDENDAFLQAWKEVTA